MKCKAIEKKSIKQSNILISAPYYFYFMWFLHVARRTQKVKKKYGNMPFNLRNFEEEAKAKMGVVECVSHKLIEPFQVLYEKHGEYTLIK